jgi:hypothetical protein
VDNKLPGIGLVVLNGFAVLSRSLNKPVKLGPDAALPAGSEGGWSAAVTWPNMAVNSPTFFRGGSIGCEDTIGSSDGASPRKGP